jgi:hypothetical protein
MNSPKTAFGLGESDSWAACLHTVPSVPKLHPFSRAMSRFCMKQERQASHTGNHDHRHGLKTSYYGASLPLSALIARLKRDTEIGEGPHDWCFPSSRDEGPDGESP